MSIVFRELGKFKKQIVFLVLTIFIGTMGNLFLPMLLQQLIDYVIPQKSYDDVFIVTGLMLVCVIIATLAGIGTARYAADISMGIGRNMRDKVFSKVNNFSQQEVDSFTVSSLITRSNTDIMNAQSFVALTLSIAVMAPVMAIMGIVMSLMSSPSLARVLIVAVPILAIVMVILGRIAIPLSMQIQEKIDRINMVIREKLTGTRVIRAFGTTQFEEKRFEEVNASYTQLNKRMMRVVGAFSPFVNIVLALTIAAVLLLAVGENAAGNSNLTTGEVIAIVNYITYVMSSVIMLSIVFLMLPRAMTSAHRVQEVLESESLILDAANPVKQVEKRGYLEFKNVSFTYAGAEKKAVNNLSFKAGPGETTAIIGGTGMGKSTIINMIPRLYDATEGQILVDGVDVRDYTLEDLRAKIGFVPQKAALFKGTIDSNISFGADSPTEQAVEEAVKVAQSYDFVMGKSKQFEEPVAQGGSNFSGGQKQRLCIARAIVRDPEIYVFDDSFSALDFKTDKMLRTALKERTQNATTVIVAQRVSTIMDADRIIVVDRGDIVGIGTHDELLETCSVYKEIVDSQMKKEVA